MNMATSLCLQNDAGNIYVGSEETDSQTHNSLNFISFKNIFRIFLPF